MTITSFEQDHVHLIYDSIALDFSRTRHTCWPFIESFLNNLSKGSIVLDAGCGNGKYLSCSTILNNKVFNPNSVRDNEVLEEDVVTLTEGEKRGLIMGKKGKLRQDNDITTTVETKIGEGRILSIGLDMSLGLLSIAAGNNYEVIRGDCFDMTCWRRGVFDHAISIAIIHHFATPERRLESVKQLILSVLPLCPPFPSSSTSSSPSTSNSNTTPIASTSTSTSTSSRQSTILIVVWALEQDPTLSGIGSARRAKKGVIPIVVEKIKIDDNNKDEISSNMNPNEKKEEEEEKEMNLEDQQDVFVKWELQAPSIKKIKKPQVSGMGKNRRRGKGDRSSQASISALMNPILPPLKDPNVFDFLPSSLPEKEAIEEAVVEEVVELEAGVEEEEVPVNNRPSFNRYYHLFKQYELAGLVQLAAQSLKAKFKPQVGYRGLGLDLVELSLSDDDHKEEEKGEGKEWKMEVELMGEVWERENWCVRIGVKWILV